MGEGVQLVFTKVGDKLLIEDWLAENAFDFAIRGSYSEFSEPKDSFKFTDYEAKIKELKTRTINEVENTKKISQQARTM